MAPAIGPIGLDYVAGAARRAGIETEALDLCLAQEPEAALRDYFSTRCPELVGLTFRNVDDCFWPSCRWFVPDLAEWVARVRGLTEAKIVLGGVGYSTAPAAILRAAGADFGVHGDGEEAIVALHEAVGGRRDLETVPGLLWRQGEAIRTNPPAWPETLRLPTGRGVIDNAAYFRLGGQGGVETKRGCNRRCIYCADPLAKGRALRLRDPAEVAAEVAALAGEGVDVLHLCDGEFNLPRRHAMGVCRALIERGLPDRVRWYAYLAVVPFDDELARTMKRAGCVGIDFTADSACEKLLAGYNQPHRLADIERAVMLCRQYGMAVMLDLLLGGPGETAETAGESIAAFKRIGPDCVGCGVGMRLYAGTPAEAMLRRGGALEDNPGIRRTYEGPVDLLRPTFYISPELGPAPAGLVRERIGGDKRFFEPADEEDLARGHNYNDNAPLVKAIAEGARGAYWHILSQLRR
jgi:radical SAM superfamily enzyme YgiQ (UPF0313 family)